MAALAAGQICLGLYLHESDVRGAVARLVEQAVLAEQSGFDGVTLAEHHAGFPTYLPNPLLASSWILESTTRLWSGPLPLLPALRPPALVAEDLAWLAVRHPGRVVAGFAAGYHEDDFVAVGDEGYARRGATYGARVREIAAALRGAADGPLAGDPALAVAAGVPLVGAAGSAAAARRAADAGVGLLMDSMSADDALATVVAAWTGAGGAGPVLLNRRVWVGEPPLELFSRQLAGYRKKAEVGSWMQAASTDALVSGAPEQIAERLAASIEASNATALGLRVHVNGLAPAAAEEQIRLVGDRVLPLLRPLLPSPSGAIAGQAKAK